MANDELLQSGMQSSFFRSELAEVYLLLDYLSGRPDKNLSTAFNGAGAPPEIPRTAQSNPAPLPVTSGGISSATVIDPASGGTAVTSGGVSSATTSPPASVATTTPVTTSTLTLAQAWISRICEIRWPPEGSRPDVAIQGTVLLLAKDHLNNAAQPASSASIAFSLLVAGDDQLKVKQRARPKSGRSTSNTSASTSSTTPPPRDENPPVMLPAIEELPPTRASLARLAYPGLVAPASAFRKSIDRINFFLVIWLVFTCMLSWNIASGRALAVRVDAAEAARLTLYKQATDPIPSTKQTDGSAATPATGGTASQLLFLGPECKSTAEPKDLKSVTFNNPVQREFCYELAGDNVKVKIARENLADWLETWAYVRGFSHLFCKDWRCLAPPEAVESKTASNDQWAAALLEILAVAVLPFFYGILGAGAAVVRNIWARMRDSQLTPRDLRLSIAQLALGAVLGACIGIFVTSPGSGAPGGATLFSAPVVLSGSALSFIAGFGVESIFVALESLITRIFNTKANSTNSH